MKNRNAVSIAITTREDAELDERAGRTRAHPGIPICAVLRGGPSIGPNNHFLRPSEFSRMPWFPYLMRVGADISDDERRPELGWNVGQAEFLAVRAALGGDLRQVLRIAVSLDSERETGRHHDARVAAVVATSRRRRDPPMPHHSAS